MTPDEDLVWPVEDDVVPPGDEMGHDEVLEEEREEEVEEEVEDQEEEEEKEEEEEEDTMMKMGINPPPKATHLKLIPKCPPTWKNWNRGAAGHAGKGHPKGRGKARGKGWSAGGKGWSAGPMRPLPPPPLAPLPPPKYPPPGMAAPPMPPPPPPPQPSDSGKQCL